MGNVDMDKLIGQLVGGREADEDGDSGGARSQAVRRAGARGERTRAAAPEGARQGARERSAGCGRACECAPRCAVASCVGRIARLGVRMISCDFRARLLSDVCDGFYVC